MSEFFEHMSVRSATKEHSADLQITRWCSSNGWTKNNNNNNNIKLKTNDVVQPGIRQDDDYAFLVF